MAAATALRDSAERAGLFDAIVWPHGSATRSGHGPGHCCSHGRERIDAVVEQVGPGVVHTASTGLARRRTPVRSARSGMIAYRSPSSPADTAAALTEDGHEDSGADRSTRPRRWPRRLFVMTRATFVVGRVLS